MHKANGFVLAFSTLALPLLAGCGRADSVNNSDVQNALAQAMLAEKPSGDVQSFPNGKSFSTNFEGGRQFVIAKKVGAEPGRPNCGRFDVTVSRPTEKTYIIGFFSGGDADWAKGVTVCVPR